jgi:hypothetical protein
MSIYNYETSLRLKTRWDILDFILLELGLYGQNICNKRPPTENEFYTIHIALICKHDITRFKQTIAQLTKPFYPYIIFTSYILFHGQNLKTAYELYQMILESYHRNPREFNEDELLAFEMLREVIETLNALSKQKKEQEKNNLSSHMMILALKLKNIRCPEHGWSHLFKNLLLFSINVHDEEIFTTIKKAIDSIEKIHDIIDQEIIKHYNIIDYTWESPVFKFFYGISKELLRKAEERNNRIKRLEERKILYEKYINYINKLKGEKIERYIYPIGLLIGVITAFIIENLIPLIVPGYLIGLQILNTYFKRKSKKIDTEIKNLRFEDLEKIIWSSK